MSRYKPYPEYKDSGVEWIGEVPAHWGVKRLGHVGDIFKGSGGNKSDQTEEGVPCLRYGEIYTRYDSFLEKPVNYVSAESASAYTPLQPGDIVFTASGEDLSEIGKAVAVIFDGPLVCGGDTIILRPRWHANHSTKFLGYLANAAPIAAQKSVSGTGFTVVHISGGKIKEVRLAWPQSGEQSQIATFLDRETARIDTLIEKKQRFIELLEEKRQAVITHAVTKGLDPNVPMKDSGVEWIGEVPAHWGAEKVGNLFAELNDRGGSKDQLLAVSQEHGVLPQAEYAATVDRRLSQSQSGDYSNYKSVEPRSFVYNKMRMWQGAIGLSRYSGCVSPAYVTFRALHPVDESFYFGVFRTGGFVSEVNRLSQGICDDQNSCSFGDFRTIFVPSPPHREQSQIATFLDRETTRIDTLIEKTRKSIELLKERRSALITAAVTGKIDVREEAA